jgi:FG-GAP repeat
MRHLFSFFGAKRAGRPLGVLTLMVGMMGTVALVAGAPPAQAAAPTGPAQLRAVATSGSSAARAARSGGTVTPAVRHPGWTQATELSDPGSGGNFGDAVAISGDTMVVGGNGDGDQGGAVYVFTGSGSSWTYVTTLNPSNGYDNDGFGYSVAVGDGIIVVGAPDYDGDGAAYVYTNGGSYSQQATFTDPGAAGNDFFGSLVGVASSSSVMVTAPFEQNEEGAVFEYTESGSNWQTTPTDTFTAPGGSDGYGDIFGEGFALQGSTMVIGAPGNPGATDPVPSNCNTSASAGCSTGTAYVYKDVHHVWTEEAKLVATNGEGCSATCSSPTDDQGGDYFGWSVAIKSSGLVAVGAPFASIPPAPDGGTSDTPNSPGTAYVFAGSGSSWAQQAEVYDPPEVTNGGQDWFGSEVAWAGKSVVTTAPYDPEGTAAGAAFVFVKQGSGWATYPTELTALDGAAGEYFGYNVLTTSGPLYVYVGGGPGHLYIFKK